MATWVRSGTGTSPSVLDSLNPLIGSVALDNATAPADFDPAGVTSVQIEFTFRTAGGPAAGDTWNDQRRADLSTPGGDAANVSTTPVSRTTIGDFATDLTDSSPNTGLTEANWEGATLDPTTADPGWADVSKDMGWDGVTISIPVSLVTVTITYTPATGTTYDETGKSVAITSSVTGTDVASLTDEGKTVAITSNVSGNDTHNQGPIDYDETGKSVAVVATVSGTDGLAYALESFTVAIVATVTGSDSIPSGEFPWTDDFTGTNADPWDTDKWTTSELGQIAAETDIQSNEGRMMTEGERDDYNSATAKHTAIQDSSVLVYVDPSNNVGTINHWLYICLRSSGEQQAGSAGRPATAYYIRCNVESDSIGVNFYRRSSNSEVAPTNTTTNKTQDTVNTPFWVRFEVEDEAGDVRIRYSIWNDAQSEPGTWDNDFLDDDAAKLVGVSGVHQLVARNYDNLGSVNDLRIDNVEVSGLGAQSYDETGKSVAIVATVTSTDVAALVDTGKTVAIVATVSGNDTHNLAGTNYDETGKTVAIVASVTGSDNARWQENTIAEVRTGGLVTITSTVTGSDDLRRVYDETGRSVAIVSTVSGSDAATRDELGQSVAITATVTGTDALAHVLESFTVNITSTVSGNDTHNVGTINYDETGKAISIVSTVSGTDVASLVDSLAVAILSALTGTDVASLSGSFTVAITSTVTGTDVHQDNDVIYDETGRSVSIVATVTGSESVTRGEAGKSVAIVSSVTGTDVGAFVELPIVDIISNVTHNDTLNHEGAYDELGRQVDIVATVSGTDVASLTDSGTVPIVSTVTGSDGLAYALEQLAVAITSTIGGTDLQAMVEASTVAIVATVTGSDDHNQALDETGKVVAIVSTVTSTDIGAFVDSVQVDVLSTVTGNDSHIGPGTAYDETGLAVAIVSSIIGTDAATNSEIKLYTPYTKGAWSIFKPGSWPPEPPLSYYDLIDGSYAYGFSTWPWGIDWLGAIHTFEIDMGSAHAVDRITWGQPDPVNYPQNISIRSSDDGVIWDLRATYSGLAYDDPENGAITFPQHTARYWSIQEDGGAAGNGAVGWQINEFDILLQGAAATVEIVATVTGNDGMAFEEPGLTIDITSTVTGTSGILRSESGLVEIVSTVGGSDVGSFTDSGIVTGNASVSSSDIMSATDSFSIAITATVTSTDATWMGSVDSGDGIGRTTEHTQAGLSTVSLGNGTTSGSNRLGSTT